MGKLEYKTRGYNILLGKKYIYFSCHPEDFDVYFGPICDEIFQFQNCAIWYNTEPYAAWDKDQLELELGQMKLFVIPITSKFLHSKNIARNTEFDFAIQHHIPILPLIQESGLETEFNDICQGIQCLNKTAISNDPTAIPYEKKLEKFLSSVLLDDKSTDIVRKAFDSRIFLSYRKKDRKYAQELMHLIHQNDFCRDVAIWYDEYIDLGEEFSKEIENEMKKSSLFTFVVTPNLYGPPDNDKELSDQSGDKENYIIENEYPIAKDSGKPILPAEMVPTDKAKLKEIFDSMPEPINAYDKCALSDALLEDLNGFESKKINNNPQHLYYIGLAYLNGIDVEIDRDRAVKLITIAAQNNIPDAMRTLSQIYKNGDGVERDYMTSAHWLEKFADYLEGKFNEDGSEEIGRDYYEALDDLGNTWKDIGELDNSISAYKRMVSLSDRLSDESDGDLKLQAKTLGYLKLGEISRIKVNLDDAEEWNLKGLNYCNGLNCKDEKLEISSLKSYFYNNLATLYWEDGDMDEALNWGLMALKLSEELDQKLGTVEARIAMTYVYNNMGLICRDNGDLETAEEFCLDALKSNKELFQETRLEEVYIQQISIYENLAYIKSQKGDLNKAVKFCQKAIDLNESWDQKVGTVTSCKSLYSAYHDLFAIYSEEGDTENAKKWCFKGLELCEKLYQKTGSLETRIDIGAFYGNLGSIYEEEGELKEAKTWNLKGLELYDELNNKDGIVYSHMDMDRVVTYNDLADICRENKELKEAKDWCMKAVKLIDGLGSKTSLDFYITCISVYNTLSVIGVEEDDKAGVEEWCLKGVELCEKENMKHEILQVRIYLAAFYCRLVIYDSDNADEWTLKASEISEELCKDLEENPKLIDVRKTLADVYSILGSNYLKNGSLEVAKQLTQKGKEFIEGINPVDVTINTRKDQFYIYKNLIEIKLRENEFEGVKDLCDQAIELGEKLCDELVEGTQLEDLQLNLIAVYGELGEINIKNKDLNDAQMNLLRAEELSESLRHKISTIEFYEDQVHTYNNLILINRSKKNLRQAKKWCQKKLKLSEEMDEHTGAFEARLNEVICYNDLGTIFREENDNENAEKCYIDGVDLGEELTMDFSENERLALVNSNIAIIYDNLGELSDAQNDLKDSKIWYWDAIVTREQLCKETRYIGDYEDLVRSYYRYGVLDEHNHDVVMLKKAELLLKQLIEIYPEEEGYKKALEILQEALLE